MMGSRSLSSPLSDPDTPPAPAVPVPVPRIASGSSSAHARSRSPLTSETEPLGSDRSSELTADEEDDEDHVPVRGAGIDPLDDEDGEEDEADEDEEEEEQVEDKHEPLPIRRHPPNRIETDSLSSASGSLSPPPDNSSSAVHRPRTSSLTPEPPEEMPAYGQLASGALDDDPLVDDEDEGDVTMRAGLPNGFHDHMDEGIEDYLTAEGVHAEDVEDPNGMEILDRPVAGEEEMVDNGEVADGDDLQDVGLTGDLEQKEAVAAEDGEEADTPANADVPTRASGPSHSSHAPPPTPGAMRALLSLELKLAALRDRLYIERMEEAAAEEDLILTGKHPALAYLCRTLSDRRERLHEVSSRRHQEALGELVRAREADKALVWTWWTDERDRLHWDEFEQTWSKRRRLAREKNEIETPKFAKAVPRPLADRPKLYNFDWSTGPAPSRLTAEDAAHDFALMENRRLAPLSRHASPGLYTQVPQYPPGPSLPPNQLGPQPLEADSSGAPRHHHHHVFPPSRISPQSSVPPPVPLRHPPPGLSYAAAASQNALGTSILDGIRNPGRTVPTSSDIFDTRRPPPLPKADILADTPGTGTGGLGLWAKQQEQRPGASGAMEAKLANGHLREHLSAPSAPNTTPTPFQPDRTTRFPGLSDYLVGIRDKSYPYGAGRATMLSPPKPSNGALGYGAGLARSPFGSNPSASAPQPAGGHRP